MPVGDVVRDLHRDVDGALLQLLALRDGLGRLLDDHLGEVRRRAPVRRRCAPAAARCPRCRPPARTGRCPAELPRNQSSPASVVGVGGRAVGLGHLLVDDADVRGVDLREERRVRLRQVRDHRRVVRRVDRLDAASEVRRAALQVLQPLPRELHVGAGDRRSVGEPRRRVELERELGLLGVALPLRGEPGQERAVVEVESRSTSRTRRSGRSGRCRSTRAPDRAS